MSAPQAAAITACTACAAVGGAAAGGAFSSSETTLDSEQNTDKGEVTEVSAQTTKEPKAPAEPTWTSLKEEITTGEPYTNEKIGHKYSNLLVGVTGKTPSSNQSWWEHSFKEFEKDQVAQPKREFSEEFKDKTKVTTAFSSNVATALNKVCETVYKQQTSTIGDENNKKKLKDDLWKYCSSFGSSPLTVKDKKDENTGENTIGKSKEEDLISTTATENTKLWDYKNNQFKALTATPTEEIFKSKHADVKAGTTTLKAVCAEAYKVNKTTPPNKPTETDVVKYCSFDKIG